MLLEVLSMNSLAKYFKSIHNNDMFEVKGMKISEVQSGIICQNAMCEIKEFNQSCSVAIYSICVTLKQNHPAIRIPILYFCQNAMCEIKEFNQSCSVAIYSICYSKTKSSSY